MAWMPTITIEQQMASIGIEITPAQMHISMPKRTLEITRELPEMSVTREAPAFRVNWKKFYNEIGHKDATEFRKSNAGNAVSTAHKATGETVADGDYMMDTRISGSRPAQIARSKLYKADETKLNFSTMPRSLPEVEWQRGTLDISWTRGHLQIEVIGDDMPELVIDPPFSIEIYLRQEPYIRVYIDDGTMPDGVGINVDKKL